MKAPKYLSIEWSSSKTTLDDVGCDGVFIESVSVRWCGWIILFIEVLCA